MTKPGRLFQVLMITAVLATWARNAQGQEALRISTAGDLAAEARKQSKNTIGYYNLLLGPTAWRFSSGLGLEYNDNVRLQQNNGEGDFIFRPNLNTQMHWPVTEKNSLDVALGVGYSAHLKDQSQNQLNISPGSGISFDIYVGDWAFNLHDRISISQNTYETPGVNTTTASLENTAGANALWDLNKVVVTFGYDHGNFVSLNSGPAQPDASTENVSANAGLRVLPELLLGIEAGSGLISYKQSGPATTPDALQWNAGMFCTAQISDYMSTRLDAGYAMYLPDATPANPGAKSQSSLYFQFMISHRVNKFISYSLSAKRSTDYSAYGQPQSYYAARLQPNLNILEKIQLSVPLWWQHGTQIGAGSASYDQYGLGINISRSITKKLSGSLSYQVIKETSNLASLNYLVNIVGLNFSYQF
ncbi:MAG: hypothetical protein WDM76_17245 [Limisphaerales bacterium]